MSDTDDLLDDEAGDDADDVSGNRVEAAVSRSVLRYVAREIVDDPESVVVESERTRNGVVLRLHVAPDDMGKVIGRRGRVAQAIRAVVRASGARDDVDVQVDIVD